MRIIFIVLALVVTALEIKNKSTGGLLEWAIIAAGIISAITYL